MFDGDDQSLRHVLRQAFVSARDLGHPRVGSEHLLLALAGGNGTVPEVLARHGATAGTVQEAVGAAAPRGAGAAADRILLASLGQDLDRLLDASGAAALDRPAAPDPLLPIGAGRARRRCARLTPPLGIDTQASYQASLRIALARRERQHRPEHLALTLVCLDPGVDWLLSFVGVDAGRLLADLAAAFPPPERNRLLGVERRIGRRSRQRGIVRRYERATGRRAVDGAAVRGLVCA